MTRLIEPGIASRVARRVAGSESPPSYLMARLERDLARAVPAAEELVAEFAGLPRPEPVAWAVIDRAAWAETNVEGMAVLLQPLEERLGPRLDALPLPARVAQRAILSVEIGVVAGYVARRVLGQYDLIIPPRRGGRRRRRAAGDATLLFVGPNLVETERRFGFVPEEFALWVAVHEVTHRFQFAGVPWLRDHFFDLVARYLTSVDVDGMSLVRRLRGAARRLASGSLPPEERNPIYLLASDQHRPLLDEIQALMAVVEGHGNFVMDHVGAQHIPSWKRMRDTFGRRRRETGIVQKIVNQVLGLELKLRQYEMGQEFCDAIYARAGAGAVGRMFASPEDLPTMDELRSPETWLRRVA